VIAGTVPGPITTGRSSPSGSPNLIGLAAHRATFSVVAMTSRVTGQPPTNAEKVAT
jgi:hypothetical protein